VGFGSYGEVKLARNTETDELVAIKFVRLWKYLYRCTAEMRNNK
jgi:serine/threonine protein kinase